MTVHEYEVALSEVTLHVAESGPEDAPAVLFLHGWGCDRRAMQRLVAEAAVHALVPDLRGHGCTGLASTRHTIPAMARDLAELLGGRGAEPMLVVAHSMGGNVAVELAICHPELVSALVVLDPAFADPYWAQAQERASDIEARGSIAVAENAHLAVAPGADPALIALIRESALQTDPRVLVEALRSTYLDPDSFGHIDDTVRRLGLLTVPLLALYPDPDRASRAGSLPVDQTVVRIADAGHFLGEEQPAAVWAAVTCWLAGRGTWT